MINQEYNFDDNFFRMVSVSLVKTLHNTISWINNFSDKKMRVIVPFYLSVAGNDRFVLDAFVDDIPNQRVELNVDQIPRGIVTFTSFNSDTSQFANPNEYLRNKRVINGKMRTLIQKTKAVPVSINYDIDIVLNSEIETFKASEKILNMLFNYMFFNIDYFGIKIDAVFSLPDDKEITIEREITTDSEAKKHVKFSLKVDTYYPIFLVEKDKFIDIDDFTICDNDDEIDWGKLYKQKPSELDTKDLNHIRSVYWKLNMIYDNIGESIDNESIGENSKIYTKPENSYLNDNYVDDYFEDDDTKQ